MIVHTPVEVAPGGQDDLPPATPAPVPEGSVALLEFRAAPLSRSLGYFQSQRFVIFGFCPGGAEVVWKDGHSSGFGTGGWRVFLEEIVPAARRHGIDLGGTNRVGTHVLWVDRQCGAVFAALREAAERSLAQLNGISPASRRCLCALLDCGSCPTTVCPECSGMIESSAPRPAVSTMTASIMDNKV